DDLRQRINGAPIHAFALGIHREFFEDKNPLDAGIVDAAVARLLLLDGVELNANTLQRERERMIYGVLKEIFKPER
ncbi:MAG: hypothetical protein IJ418_11730, partial [Clostridia bacterium]|nr:hypothetical protein [Clostridia bacterium]